MSKQKLTLYAEAEIVEEMKIQAVREKKSLSVITENLYREYLKRKTAKGKAKQ
jgi:hypothetical protein